MRFSEAAFQSTLSILQTTFLCFINNLSVLTESPINLENFHLGDRLVGHIIILVLVIVTMAARCPLELEIEFIHLRIIDQNF